MNDISDFRDRWPDYAERLGISPEDAFHEIRSAARHQSIKLVVVCRRVIDTDYTPG